MEKIQIIFEFTLHGQAGKIRKGLEDFLEFEGYGGNRHNDLSADGHRPREAYKKIMQRITGVFYH